MKLTGAVITADMIRLDLQGRAQVQITIAVDGNSTGMNLPPGQYLPRGGQEIEVTVREPKE